MKKVLRKEEKDERMEVLKENKEIEGKMEKERRMKEE